MTSNEWVDDDSPFKLFEQLGRVFGRAIVYGVAVTLTVSFLLLPPTIGTALGMYLVQDMAIDGTEMGALFIALFTIAGSAFDLGLFMALDEENIDF